jgi:hypothetical protein
MPILAIAHRQLTVLAAAALALTGAAALGAAAPAGAAVHRGLAPRPAAAGRAAPGTVGGLVVSLGYAEHKANNAPPRGTFPSPWRGSPGVTFLGNTIPNGGSQCTGVKRCYDAGAIRLDNPTASPVTVSKVVVNDHASLSGGKIFSNLWGSFTVQPGKSVILTENPAHANDGFDDFDTSGYPSSCTPITVAPKITFTIGGVNTTVADSTHILDTGGVDPGSCSPTHNESIQWRAIGTSASAATSCPTPWTCADIGNPIPPGSQSFNSTNHTWTISAGGADITGLADEFRFVWQTLPGNGSVIAHVLTQTNTSPGAKAGVMLRASTAAGSPNYALLVSPGEGIKVQVRKTLNGDTQKLANPTGTVPAWLKITRSVNTYTAYTSTNGTTWTLIPGSAITINLGTSMLAGLAVTSHNSGVLGTATMKHVKVG